MLNCSTCVYLDAENHYCKRRVHNVPGVCPYAEERKPRNNFEMLKAMSMEELAFELAQSGCPKVHFIKDNEFVNCPADREPSRADCVKCWFEWLKEEITDA